VLALVPLAGAAARGVGGFTWGQQYFDADLSNVNLAVETNGVYGYTVTWGGQRYGGFVLAAHSGITVPELHGGFVGGIAGQEARLGPVVLAVTAWTGFGGMNLDPLTGRDGSFSLFGELTLEAGFGFLPGVQVTGYAGLQAIAPVLPGPSLIQGAVYTPVFGMRVAWGS